MSVIYRKETKDYETSFCIPSFYVGKALCFSDQENSNTLVKITIKAPNELLLEKEGDFNLSLIFRLDEKTYGEYHYRDESPHPISVITRSISLTKERIIVIYDSNFEDISFGTNKIDIKVN